MLTAVDLLASKGATVVWLTTPPVSNRPERTDRLNDMIKALPGERPGKVVVVDLAANLAARPDFGAMRPDGIHLSADASHRVANDFLIPRLAAIWKGDPRPPGRHRELSSPRRGPGRRGPGQGPKLSQVPSMRHLTDPGLGPVAQAVGEHGGQALALGVGERHRRA